jgi:hypothetical protein
VIDGLATESLDIQADTLVYGPGVGEKKRVAVLAGYFRLVLAALVLSKGENAARRREVLDFTAITVI